MNTLEQVANYEPPIPEQYYNDGNDIAYTEGHKKGFIVGANWQKEQYKEVTRLMSALIGAYDIRHPEAKQLLVGYTNSEVIARIRMELKRLQD